MTFTPRLRKFLLTSHITFSIGWLGAVAVFFALGIAALTSTNSELVRAVYYTLQISAWYVIVPFCLASLVTGVIQALGTKWGLFKHYWIVVKLLLTIVMTVLLLLHMQPISYLAGVAADDSFSDNENSRLFLETIAKAGAALLVLIAVVTISVYKPWGKIQYGNSINVSKKYISNSSKKPVSFYLLIALAVLIAIVLIIHLFGGGMRMK